MKYTGINRVNAAGLVFSAFLLAILYVFIEPPLWLFLLVGVFLLITHAEELFHADGLFGIVASLLLLSGGIGGIFMNEAVAISVVAIIVGIIAAYRSATEFRSNITI